MKAASGGVCPQGPHTEHSAEWGSPQEKMIPGSRVAGSQAVQARPGSGCEIWARCRPTRPQDTLGPPGLVSPQPGWGAPACAHLTPTHSRSQVLCASTHRLGLSWLGHTPGWPPGPGGRLAPAVSPARSNSGRSGLRAGMRTAGPQGGVARVTLRRPCRAPHPAGIHPPRLVIHAPAVCPGLPVPQGWSPHSGHWPLDRVEQSLCMWHSPPPAWPPLVSSGQGAGRQGWLGEGLAPRSTETLATRVTEGAEKGSSWTERGEGGLL